MAAEQLTARAFAPIDRAAGSRYAYGRNDCLTLIVDLVVSGGSYPAAVEAAVGDACERYRRANYVEAMQAATREHGSIGAAMLAELVDGAGLAPADGEPQPGDVLLFEGRAAAIGGSVLDSREAGTFEIVIDDLRDWWAWTTAGLRPARDVFEAAAFAATGGIRCLLP